MEQEPTARLFSITLSAERTDAVIDEAYQEACKLGLGAMDALHVAAAMAVHADELITIERPTSPLHRVTCIKVITLYPGSKS